MTVQIHRPELEKLVRDEIENGRFASVDDLISEALQALRERGDSDLPKSSPLPIEASFAGSDSNQEPKRGKNRRPEGKKSLAQLFAESPLKGMQIDFERDPDYGRDIEL